MAVLKFYIRVSGKAKTATIRTYFSTTGQPIIYAKTPHSIPINIWDSDSGNISKKAKYTNDFTSDMAQDIFNNILKIESLVFTTYNKNKNALSKNWLQHIIDKYYSNEEKEKKDSIPKESLIQYMERYGEEIESGKRLNKKNKKYAGSTIKSRKYSYGVLKDFMKEYKKRFNFDDVSMDFYKEFIHFCNEKEYSPQTTGKHIKALKEIMSASMEDKLHTNITTLQKSFRTPYADSDTVYLTAEEVKAIISKDLTAFPNLQISRDVFLCGIFVAQRYCDYRYINPSQIIKLHNKKKALRIIQKKGDSEVVVVIPISPILDTILKKYNYELPYTYSQKINEDIKDICFLAGITQKVEHKVNKGASTYIEKIEKYKLISCHTARRTGATLLYLDGIDTIAIMKITGHKTEKEFLKYIRVTAEENALRLSQIDYFSRGIFAENS